MKHPKTIKGYIKLVRKLECIPLTFLKGFDKLTEQQKQQLYELSGSISNNINEYID